MQEIKYRKPIPVYVLVIAGLLIASLVIALLAFTGIIDLTFVADGLIAVVTVPYLWAGASWINGLTFTVVGIIILGVLFLAIAKRRYLVAQKAVVVGAVASGPQLQSQLKQPLFEEPTVKKEEEAKSTA